MHLLVPVAEPIRQVKSYTEISSIRLHPRGKSHVLGDKWERCPCVRHPPVLCRKLLLRKGFHWGAAPSAGHCSLRLLRTKEGKYKTSHEDDEGS